MVFKRYPWFTENSNITLVSVNSTNEPMLMACLLDDFENCEKPGIYVEYMFWILRAAPFNVKLIFPPNGSYGNFVNGTWDGLVGTLHRGEADMSIHPLFMTEQRQRYVNYGPVWHSESMFGFLTLFKTPEAKYFFTPLFDPLQPSVYITFAGITIFVFTYIYAYFTWIRSVESSSFHRFGVVFEKLLTHNFNCLGWRKTFPVTILSLTWCVVLLFLVYAYQTSLIGVLTFRRYRAPFKNLQQAVNLYESGRLNFVIHKDYEAAFYDLLEVLPSINADYEPLTAIFRKERPILANSTQQFIDLLKQPDKSFFGDVLPFYYKLQSDEINGALLNFVPTMQTVTMSSVMFRKNFEYRETFAVLLSMLSDNVEREIRKKYFPNLNTGYNKTAKTIKKRRAIPLSFADFSSSLIMFTVGCSFSTICFLLEIVHYVCKEKRTRI